MRRHIEQRPSALFENIAQERDRYNQQLLPKFLSQTKLLSLPQKRFTYLLSGSAEPELAETVAAPEGAVQAAPFGGAAPAADAPSVASVPKYFSDTPGLCVSC